MEFEPVGIMPGGEMRIMRESPTLAYVWFKTGSVEPAHHHIFEHDLVVIKGKKKVWNITKKETYGDELTAGAKNGTAPPAPSLRIYVSADAFGCVIKDALVGHHRSLLDVDVVDLGTDKYYSIGEHIGLLISSPRDLSVASCSSSSTLTTSPMLAIIFLTSGAAWSTLPPMPSPFTTCPDAIARHRSSGVQRGMGEQSKEK